MIAETEQGAHWKTSARKAIDTWAPTLEASVADAIKRGYREGIVFSAKAADAKGQKDLARELRAAAGLGSPLNARPLGGT